LSDYALYREPTVLESVKHRGLKLAPLVDHAVASRMQASFLAAAEFTQAAREYTIVFVRSQVEGKSQVHPVVMLGVAEGENLFVAAAEGSAWDARYVPAYVRRYPFWTTQVDDTKTQAVLIDAWWRGFSETDGEPLYEADGQPAKRLIDAIDFLKRFDFEAERALAFCARLVELDLLQNMTVTATLPGETPLALDGFLAVDEAKLLALPEAQVAEMHRNGMLGLVYAHLASLGNLQALLDRKARRMNFGAPGGLR
jgi:SapC